MKFKNTTTHEIGNIIHSIKSKDSSGYDEISSRILKISAPYVLSPLTFIVNKILSTGIFPERLKLNPYTRKVTILIFLIIGLSHYLPHFQNLLKKLFIKDCIVI